MLIGLNCMQQVSQTYMEKCTPDIQHVVQNLSDSQMLCDFHLRQ